MAGELSLASRRKLTCNSSFRSGPILRHLNESVTALADDGM